jgi:alpha-tubulin suppressor-like RCC1 family protein
MRSFAAVVVVVAVALLLAVGATSSTVAARPVTLSFTRIAAGQSTTCAVTSAGGAKCWGYNADDQVGIDYRRENDAPTPVDVVGLTSGVRATSVGSEHACALTSAGGVKCWGRNEFGQLGNGRLDEHPTSAPVRVVGLGSGVRAIATGYGLDSGHTCAITAAGGVKCWGEHPGLGPPVYSSTPVQVIGLTSGVSAITAGDGYSCALTSAGGVKCWGEHPGLGPPVYSSTPVQVIGLTSGVSAITAGDGYSCALTSAGGVKCWGENETGQLGDGGPFGAGASATPVDVVGLSSGVKAVAAGGGSHTCAVTGAGAVECWGNNDYGQLGNASSHPTSTPVDVVGLSGGVKAIAAGGHHTCALTSGGAVKCWGENENGQLGNGSTTNPGSGVATPVQVFGLTGGVTAITAGIDYSCALLRGGGAKCWGHNFAGQLGNGSTKDSSTPVAVRLSAKGTPKTTPTTTSRAVHTLAVSFESYLAQMARDRAKLKSVLTSVATCSISPGAAAVQVAAVSAGRQRLLNAVTGFAAPTLQAAQIKAALQQSLTYSAAADRAYHDWLAQQGAHCPAAHTPVFGNAQQQDRLATAAKERFVAAFNPLARRLHLRTWSANMI